MNSWVARGLIDAFQKRIPDESLREELYVDVIEVLEGEDWDTVDECLSLDPAFDRAVIRVHPEWDEE